jgi:hypothetical protein
MQIPMQTSEGHDGGREDHANHLWLARHNLLSTGRLVIVGTAGLRNNSLAPSVIIVADRFMNRNREQICRVWLGEVN